MGPTRERSWPCQILRDRSIPFVIWGEDALAHHGVPTVGFHLYLLVRDLCQATETLLEHQWQLEDPNSTQFGNIKMTSDHRRLSAPVHSQRSSELFETALVLLPASDWKWQFGPDNLSYDNFPSLPALLDSLISRLLDISLDPMGEWRQVKLLIAYLYSYVPDLKSRGFALLLNFDNRQFHYDSLSDMSTSTIQFVRHERKVRDAIRFGNFELCNCSASADDGTLFQAGTEAGLRASMGICITPEQWLVEVQKQEEEEIAQWSALERAEAA